MTKVSVALAISVSVSVSVAICCPTRAAGGQFAVQARALIADDNHLIRNFPIGWDRAGLIRRSLFPAVFLLFFFIYILYIYIICMYI